MAGLQQASSLLTLGTSFLLRALLMLNRISSVVAFVFGAQRCPVTVIPDPVAVARRGTSFDVPQISFAYYGIAYGEIGNDGRPFAMCVFKDIGEDSRWFPPI